MHKNSDGNNRKFKAKFKLVNNNLKLTIVELQFNVCRVTKIRGMISGYMKFIQEWINIELKCPFKKGFIELRCGKIPRHVMKAMSPGLISSPFAGNSKSIEFTFTTTVTLLTRIDNVWTEFLQHEDKDVKMSNFQ